MTPVILIIMDGYGIAKAGSGNAVYLAHPKNLTSYLNSYPNTQLKASGEAVGLPDHEVGNTEVGHINMGAGRIVYQSLPRINLAIADGSFYKNEVFMEGVDHIQKSGGNLHILGLVGAGSVHANINHLHALLHLAKENNVKNVFIHVITDGRDSPPKMAKTYIQELQDKLDTMGLGKIASIMGRYYGMDRDKHWERIEKAYNSLAKGEGSKAETWQEVIDHSYSDGKTDEFIEPTLITGKNNEINFIKKGDTVIFFNYRIDRPRELTRAFVVDNFEEEANKDTYDPFATKYLKSHLVPHKAASPTFNRPEKIENLFFITMTEYEEGLPVHIAFPRHVVKMPVGRIISENELSQLRVAESEKERFVTYYFNGLRDQPFPHEDRVILPSQRVATYDLAPQMSAHEIADTVIKNIITEKYKFILINFANADMVGHTGSLPATVKAITELDDCVGKIVEQALKFNYMVMITADHGNAESMIDTETGGVETEHTGNPVPFIAIHSHFQGKNIKLPSGILADIAPTILSALQIPKPMEMTGRDLLEEIKGI